MVWGHDCGYVESVFAVTCSHECSLENTHRCLQVLPCLLAPRQRLPAEGSAPHNCITEPQHGMAALEQQALIDCVLRTM